MTKHNGISFIIVTYRPGQELKSCIESIYNNVFCRFEVIIVDNSEELNPLLREISEKFKDITLLQLPNNPGFGTANNHGSRISIYSHLIFLNPDAELRSRIDDPEILYSSDAGFISGYCIDENSIFKKTAGIFPKNPWRLISFSRRLDQRPVFNTGRFSDKQIPIDYAEGSLMLVSAEFFKKIGGFDENIFMYGEDYEISYRAVKAGKQNYIHGGILYFHKGGFNHTREPLIVSGLLYFAKKHLSPGREFWFRVALFTRYCLIFITCLTLGFFDSKRQLRLKSVVEALRRCIL